MTQKRALYLVLLAVLYTGMMGAGTCGKKAMNQIVKAEAAVDTAREADAPQYAPDEFKSAEEALAQAKRQYKRYLFKRAESSAITAEEKARQALELAEKNKAVSEEEQKKKDQEEAAKLAYNVSSLFGATTVTSSLEEQAALALHDVHFDFDSAGLSDAAKQILTMNAEWLLQHPTIKVEIEGHCDERGTEEYNLALGAKRAKAVFDFMVSLGVDPSRMRTISYGESVPLDPGHNEEAWAKNRRVHFAVILE